MTDELIEAPAAPHPINRLREADTATLRQELARALTITAEHLVYLAAVWQELERRGEDLSDLRAGLTAYLPLIAAGQLDAEVVVRFAAQRTLLRAISSLPIKQQQHLARGGSVEILVPDVDGVYRPRERAAHLLTAQQARLVFDAGRLRSPREQEAIVESSRVSARHRARRKTAIVIDPASGRLRIGSAEISLSEIQAAIARAYTPPTEGVAKTATVPVALTEDEHRALRIRAAEGNVSMRQLLRGALATLGLIAIPASISQAAPSAHAPPRGRDRARTAEIVERLRRGDSMADIAREFEISRERVHQIAQRYGFRRGRERSERAAQRAAARSAARAERHKAREERQALINAAMQDVAQGIGAVDASKRHRIPYAVLLHACRAAKIGTRRRRSNAKYSDEQLAAATGLLRAGKSVDEVAWATGVGQPTLRALKRSIGV